MRAHDGGVDHHVFVVVIIRQQLENAFENPTPGPPAEAVVGHFPITEAFRIHPRLRWSARMTCGAVTRVYWIVARPGRWLNSATAAHIPAKAF
jgi:hypothetical protein